jgi:uncharacterized protein (TIGR02145 family)
MFAFDVIVFLLYIFIYVRWYFSLLMRGCRMNGFTRYVPALLFAAAAVAAVAGCAAPNAAARVAPEGGVAGTLTDTRDGRVYRTADIAGKRWMAENLNFKAGGSWCYGDSAGGCGKYGRLYSWKAAMKACPAGWRLPSAEEWDGLVEYAGGERVAGGTLKAAAGWNDYEGKDGNGSDDFGFSALPGGFRGINGLYSDIGRLAFFWTSTVDDSEKDFAFDIFLGTGRKIETGDDGEMFLGDAFEVVAGNGTQQSQGYSVRCVMGD